jgi:hypothetical protein
MLLENDPLKPVAFIIGVWSVCLVILTIFTALFLKRLPAGLKNAGKIRNEDGFSYALSFIMTVPFLMMILILFIETTLVLTTLGGVQYSAYAAARAAIVWDWAEPAAVREEKIELAAVHALAPFSSSNATHLDPRRRGLAIQDITYSYCNAYFKYTGDEAKVANNYLVRKLYYARQGMQYSYTRPSNYDSIVKANVIYEHPFHFPFVGRALGKPSSTVANVRVFQLKAGASLQNEGAKTNNKTLGISYDSDY